MEDDGGQNIVHKNEPIKEYKSLFDFLKDHSKKPQNDSSPSHTRIGDKESKIAGGAYYIPDNKWNTFMDLYWKDVIQKKKSEYLTEKQMSDQCPIAIDLDLHFALDFDERYYSQEHLDDLVDLYLGELKEIFQFDENTAFSIYMFEKKNLNKVPEKNITKDGIHMVIGIKMDHKAQCILRERVLSKIGEVWNDCPIVNKWNDVFDEGISKGYTNWQLYGSCKPNHEAYQITSKYDITYDGADGEFINERIEIDSKHLNKEMFKQFSVRYCENPEYLYKTSFLGILDNRTNHNPSNTTTQRKTSPITALFDEDARIKDINKIKSREDLEHYLHMFLESIQPSEYILRELYEYTTVLPDTYYGPGSYTKWIRVGWALKNTSNKLLIVWLAFSARSSSFTFDSVPELCELWESFGFKRDSGITKRSIIYWAKQENSDGADEIHKNTVGYYLDMTINAVTANAIANPSRNAKGSTDYDIAVVLHQMYKDEYVCSCVEKGKWFRFRKHRWNEIDCGNTLRRSISTDLRGLYEQKVTELQNYLVTLDPDEDQYKHVKAKIEMVLKITQRLGQTSDKRNIMQEARDIFYDDEFYNRLDSNPYLLGCKNGVIDFEAKEFRNGRPEDYITKSTNINYYPLSSSKHKENLPELQDFMAKLFVNEELRNYMWNHLSAVLIGKPSLNQALYNYIGFGQNGKSVLTDLMSHTLGTYKESAPISLITQARGKIGGLAPEIVKLKGSRYVVMQEPDVTDIIQEGPMKELVSGVEPISARAPFMIKEVTFIPQFALVVCCNQLLNVRTQDHGTWRRLKVVKYESLFTENPVDNDPDRPYQFKVNPDLLKKFPIWRETFLAMLVQNAFENEGKVRDCDSVLEASTKYRESQDHVSQFIGERVTRRSGSRIRKEQISEEFKLWFVTNCGKQKQPSPKQVYEYMDRQYGKNRSGIWMDVKLVYPSDGDRAMNTEASDSGSELDIPEVQLSSTN